MSLAVKGAIYNVEYFNNNIIKHTHVWYKIYKNMWDDDKCIVFYFIIYYNIDNVALIHKWKCFHTYLGCISL